MSYAPESSMSFGAWRCRVFRADGSMRCNFMQSDRDGPAERTVRGWHHWIATRLEPGETRILQWRPAGASRFADVQT